MRLLFASQNHHKFAEVKEILADVGGLSIVSLNDVGLLSEEVEEDGESYVANAGKKARFFARKSNLPTIADDSGLSINSLDGFPGIKSKRFAGLDKTNQRFEIILDLIKDKDRKAEFVTAICFFNPETNQEHCVEGRIKGSIAKNEAGDEGFEYDRIFTPEGENKTLAELGIEYKNQHSARKIALEKIRCLF